MCSNSITINPKRNADDISICAVQSQQEPALLKSTCVGGLKVGQGFFFKINILLFPY